MAQIIPAPITELTQVIPAVELFTWERLSLSDTVATLDPNSIVVSATDGASTTVEVLGGTATNAPDTAATWFWNYKDIHGRDLDLNKVQDIQFVIEVTTPPGEASDYWVALSVSNTLDLSQENTGGGLVYDAAGGPDMRFYRVLNGGAYVLADSGASPATVKVLINLSIGASTFKSVAGWSYNVNDVPLTTGNVAGTVLYSPSAAYIALSIGRKTNVAGNASASFKLWVKPTMALELPA